MTTTREYSSSASRDLTGDFSTPNWKTGTIAALGDYAGDYDVDAITDEYVAEIGKLMPKGYTLCGEFIFQDVDVPTLTQEELSSLRDSVEGVDFWAIAAKHEIAK